MAWQKEPDPRKLTKFAGIRNTVEAHRFGQGDLEAAVNCDIDESGNLSRAAGYTSRLAAAGAHSLYAKGDLCLFVQGTSLKRLSTAYVATTLRTVTTGLRMSYWTVNGRTYFSNGVDTGVIETNGVARTWGLTPPADAGVAAWTPGGTLKAGKYQWMVTFLRIDGQESGALVIPKIEIDEDNFGLSFTDLPLSDDPGVAGRLVYVSKQNGDVRYEALWIPNNTDTTAIYWGGGPELVRPSETEDLMPAPAGQCVSYFRGRTIVAVGSVLYPSLPYAHELFDLRNYFDFDAPITLLAPVEDGIYVCTSNHNFWLPGLDPKDWNQVVKTDRGAIPGTLTYVDGKHVGEGVAGIVALWLSASGICLGTNGGNFKVLSADRVNANIVRDRGASIVVDRRLITAVE